MHHSTDRIAHTTAFIIPVVEHWLEQEIAQKGCMDELDQWIKTNRWVGGLMHWWISGYTHIHTCTCRM